MGAIVTCGAQWGSEGKGKLSLYLSRKFNAKASVRVGGPNSGHTVIGPDGQTHVLRMLPSACVDPDVIAVIPAGACIDVEILRSEIYELGLGPGRLAISPYAGIIDRSHVYAEREMGLPDRIGSTGSGTGACVMSRIRRDAGFRTAAAVPELERYLRDTTAYMRSLLDGGAHIVIEGTQGYGLSLYQSPWWPYVTSRDATAAQFVAEAGLSPRDVSHVAMAVRTYPIRVGGESGPLPRETTWEEVTELAGSATPIREYTSVTHRLRRVARFDPDVVARAVRANAPDIIAVNFMDYIHDPSVHEKSIGPERRAFLDWLERDTGAKASLAGFGPDSLVTA